MFSPSTSLFRLSIVVALSLFALLLLESKAQAGCGDYVLISGRSVHAAQTGPDPSPIKTPCHGPNCSAEQQSLPPVTTAPTTTISGERDPAAVGLLTLTCSFRGPLLRHSVRNDDVPLRLTQLPFVPPKI